MNAQEEAWSGEFGDAYTVRNRVNWMSRIPFWKQIMERTSARSVLEIGCNAGWNLTAIKEAAPWSTPAGIDVNQNAVEEAVLAGCDVTKATVEQLLDLKSMKYDLVFTSGCLIHVHPVAIEQMMKNIIALSSRYVLCVEYDSTEEQEINYRGNAELLWKRPHGRLYQDLGLKLVSAGLVTRQDGFDECNSWLLEKP